MKDYEELSPCMKILCWAALIADLSFVVFSFYQLIIVNL